MSSNSGSGIMGSADLRMLEGVVGWHPSGSQPPPKEGVEWTWWMLWSLFSAALRGIPGLPRGPLKPARSGQVALLLHSAVISVVVLGAHELLWPHPECAMVPFAAGHIRGVGMLAFTVVVGKSTHAIQLAGLYAPFFLWPMRSLCKRSLKREPRPHTLPLPSDLFIPYVDRKVVAQGNPSAKGPAVITSDCQHDQQVSKQDRVMANVSGSSSNSPTMAYLCSISRTRSFSPCAISKWLRARRA